MKKKRLEKRSPSKLPLTESSLKKDVSENVERNLDSSGNPKTSDSSETLSHRASYHNDSGAV